MSNTPSTEQSWIGRSVKRREDPPLIQGQGRYSADNHAPGTVHMAVRRAGVPRANGLKVDVSAALKMPGVVGAWAVGQMGLADDYMPDPNPQQPLQIRRPVLAKDEVRFEGDAVAVVAAETEYQAHDAVDAIEVELNPISQTTSALPAQSFRIGDAAAAIDQAPVRVRQRLAMARIAGAAMEPRAAFADWRDTEQTLYIRASVGGVHVLRETIARCLGLERTQVVALSEDVGGSFGAKNHPYPEYIMAAAISRLLKRPVRWVANRSEDGHTTGQAHAADLDMDIASDQDGRIAGLRGKYSWTVGGYLGRGAFQEMSMAAHTMSAYRLPAFEIEVTSRFSDTPPSAFIRGGGRPVGNFAIERMIDRLARRLDLDPIELRRRNLIRPTEMPYDTGLNSIVYDGGDYPRLLELAVERIDAADVRRRQQAGAPVGVGVAMCIESTGMGMPEASRVAVMGDGTVRVFVGSTPQGQGHQTFMAQVVADRLGWPIDRIEVSAGDSRNVANSFVTAASRSALEFGNSVALSAASARRMLLERASQKLEAAAEDLVLAIGGAGVRGVPDRRVSLEDLVGDGLEAAEAWDSKGRTAWASSCHAAVVRVDAETGGVDIERYVIAHDSGRAINPMILEGQLHGGYAHGLGYALFEEALYSPDGNFQSPSFLDYSIVSAPELRAEPELIHTETPTGHNPEGFRGAGEAGTIAVPAAIANAIEDAIYAMGYNVAIDSVPVTPLKLWNLMQSSSRRAPS
ncbi:MAG TPA: xanthine dehydrogenase family protein molybdopterin-binding subunit [Candidatus Dormibacteraeota bacterium]|nr:xanthine dehydrogenase family protein molybdopterin-binding subunit [Candidatus Dormibacteraeota bacterium]